MLYLIGLGLNAKGISQHGLEIVKRCKKVYLEGYTVDFPYSNQELQDVIGKKFAIAGREKIESFEIVDEAKKLDVALLVYGSPLTATTHISLVYEAKKSRVKCRVIYSASVLDAVAETGLQIYKFGKITSLPEFEADSFIDVVRENQSINAHSLILVDIGLELENALEKIERAANKKGIKLNRIILCQGLGTKHKKIIYDRIENLKELRAKMPFCIIIPSKLHFVEKEILEGFGSKVISGSEKTYLKNRNSLNKNAGH